MQLLVLWLLSLPILLRGVAAVKHNIETSLCDDSDSLSERNICQTDPLPTERASLSDINSRSPSHGIFLFESIVGSVRQDQNRYVQEHHSSHETWRDAIEHDNGTVVYFYKPYCGACTQVAPAFRQLCKHMKDHQVVCIAVSCHKQAYRDLCDRENISKYPTIVLFDQNGRSLGAVPLHHLHPLHVVGKAFWTQPSRNQDSSCMRQSLISLLRHNLYPQQADLAKNPNDPPLLVETRNALFDFLSLFPKEDALVHELLDAFLYITKHEDWLRAILDENDVDMEQHVPLHDKDDTLYWDGLWDGLFRLLNHVAVWNNMVVWPSTEIAFADVVKRFQDMEAFVGFCLNRDATENENCPAKLFRQMTPNLNDGQEFKSLTLWLAKMRWQKSGSEWPSRKSCPACWNDTEQWVANNVYAYILQLYGIRAFDRDLSISTMESIELSIVGDNEVEL